MADLFDNTAPIYNRFKVGQSVTITGFAGNGGKDEGIITEVTEHDITVDMDWRIATLYLNMDSGRWEDAYEYPVEVKVNA